MLDANKIATLYRDEIEPPLSADEIAKELAALPFAVPEEYRAFLSISNGMQTPDDLILLGAEELGKENEDYQVQTHLPGYIMIGNDGGGVAVLIKQSDAAVYEVAMGTMNEADMVASARSFNALMIDLGGTPYFSRE